MAWAQRRGTNTAPASGRYLSEYTKESDLVLTKNWRSWVYVGSPLTPYGLTEGKEGFSQYHNVYIELGSSTLVTLGSITGAFSWWRNIPGTGAAT